MPIFQMESITFLTSSQNAIIKGIILGILCYQQQCGCIEIADCASLANTIIVNPRKNNIQLTHWGEIIFLLGRDGNNRTTEHFLNMLHSPNHLCGKSRSGQGNHNAIAHSFSPKLWFYNVVTSRYCAGSGIIDWRKDRCHTLGKHITGSTAKYNKFPLDMLRKEVLD